MSEENKNTDVPIGDKNHENDTLLSSKHIQDEFDLAGDTKEDDEIRVTASEKTREAARKKLNEEMQEEQDKEKGLNKEGENKETNASFNGDESQGNALTIKHLARHGIYDKGDHLSLKAKGKDPRTGKRQISDEQLRNLLIASVNNKGWSEIALYKGNKIDRELTNRAHSMMENDSVLQAVIHKKPRFQNSLIEEPPPWIKSSLGKRTHRGRYRNERLSAANDHIKSVKKSRKTLDRLGFESKEGTKEARDKLSKQLKEGKEQIKALKKGLPATLIGGLLRELFSKQADLPNAVPETRAPLENPEAQKTEGSVQTLPVKNKSAQGQSSHM